MKLEFYIDYLCPKCYLQHKIIENLVDKKLINKDIIIYRNFEMVDDVDFDGTISFIDFISKYKKLPKSEVIDFLKTQNLEIKLFPIHNVHRMAHVAKKEKKSFDYTQAVFKAMYEDHIDLSVIQNLRALAIQVGLSKTEVDLVLSSDKYNNAVISNKENGQLKGVSDLPFLRVNQCVKLKGIQNENAILSALEAQDNKREFEHCIDGHCSRKHVH